MSSRGQIFAEVCYNDILIFQITTSGYGTESAGGLGRSDTLESVANSDSLHKESEKKRDIFQDDEDDDDDDLFKSARIEPEPQARHTIDSESRHTNGFNGDSMPAPDKEINLDDDDDEEPPFKVSQIVE